MRITLDECARLVGVVKLTPEQRFYLSPLMGADGRVDLNTFMRILSAETKISVDEAVKRLGMAGEIVWREAIESIADADGMVDIREADKLPLIKSFRQDLSDDLETAFIERWRRSNE